MGYLGNAPLLSTMRTLVEGVAYTNQVEIPVPGGFNSGMVDVIIGGAELSTGDFDDSNAMSIKGLQPMAAGTQYKVVAWTPNQTVVNAGGQLAGFRNKLINGNFDIWQRGTSLSAAVGYRYLADRWGDDANGSTAAVSQQTFTPGQTAVPGEPAYFHRTVVASVAGAANYVRFRQAIESVRTLAGQTATVSFWAKADATRNITVELEQVFGTGGSPSSGNVGIGSVICTLTTNWQQFKVTVSVTSISGKTIGTNGDDNLALNFWLDSGTNYNARSNSLGQQSGTFDFARIQLEPGSVATTFEQRPLGLELSLCQRYFKSGNFWSTMYVAAAAGQGLSPIPLPVSMRMAPAMTYSVTTYANCSAISTYQTNPDYAMVTVTGTAAGPAYAWGTFTASAEF